MQHFFSKLTYFLEKEVKPIANALDEEEALYRRIYPAFVTLGGLNLLVPKALGGLGAGRQEWIEYNILMAQYSGALLFLQAQHQFCVARLKQLLPNPNVEKVLRSFVQEGRGMGLALAKNKNVLTVIPSSEGFFLSGTLRWCTGKNFFSHLLISFQHEDNLFYTLLPFKKWSGKKGVVSIGPKIETAVFNAVPSNSVTLEKYLVAKSNIIATHPVGGMPSILHPSAYNTAGVAKALLQLIRKSTYGASREVLEKQQCLEQSWEHYYKQLHSYSDNPRGLRRQGVQLVEECALLARIACGSAGILRSHPLGRLIRESWQYTVAGYSEEQLKAYLDC